MIQRIQHFYLFLIAAICFSFLYVPILSGHFLEQPHTSYSLTSTGFFIYEGGHVEISEKEFVYIAIMLGLISAMAFLNIFLFRNRNLQNAFCLLNYPLMVALVYCISSEWFSQIDEHYEQMPIDSISFGSFVKLILIICLPILNYLAMRGLRKDEELIHSADRVR